MLKSIRLFSWFKRHWKLSLAIAAVLVVAFAVFQGVRADKWLKEHHRLEGKLEEQKADQDRFREEVGVEREIRKLKEAEERKEREKLEARIQQARREGERAKIELEKEKKKTATLEPTELVLQINKRIGKESELTTFSLFPIRFTRVGANRTLDRFKDGEFYLSEYNRHLKVIGDLETNATSFAISLAKCEEAEATNLKGWDDCRETLATAIESKEAQKKAFKANLAWSKVKAFIGGGLAVFIIDKIFGVF